MRKPIPVWSKYSAMLRLRLSFEINVLPCAIDSTGHAYSPSLRGLVNQELFLRNEYLAAENRILRAHVPSRLRLSVSARSGACILN